MRITKVYTRTGDKGETRLVYGQSVSKADPQIESYGTVDELSSFLGVARGELARGANAESDAIRQLNDELGRIQNDLFDVGAALAVSPTDSDKFPSSVDEQSAKRLEDLIDAYNATLPPLKEFVLPGGSPAVAAIHVARCVARRAERCVVRLDRDDNLANAILVYLNRLSDFLFVVARWTAAQQGVSELIWQRDESDG